MGKRKILDCTLRDGGYITDWVFGKEVMKNIIAGLEQAGIDLIECGYINPNETKQGKAIFCSIDQIKELLPSEHKTLYLAMADCAQIKPKEITPCLGDSIEGIRVVFYKHQIEEAMKLCQSVKENGYKLFVQPMVTIDYSFDEYKQLAERIRLLKPYAVSIVDSFGYMNKEDFRAYFSLLDGILDKQTAIGFHSHNNMQFAFITAQDVLDYKTDRELIIDASLYGMGRGAGNLHTELITNYYNRVLEEKYDLSIIMRVISKEIMPIARSHTWGYSPYLFLTGLYHCHPNFACYLLEEYDVSVEEFEYFVRIIPEEMKTKCRRPYVKELYQDFLSKKNQKEEAL